MNSATANQQVATSVVFFSISQLQLCNSMASRGKHNIFLCFFGWNCSFCGILFLLNSPLILQSFKNEEQACQSWQRGIWLIICFPQWWVLMWEPNIHLTSKYHAQHVLANKDVQWFSDVIHIFLNVMVSLSYHQPYMYAKIFSHRATVTQKLVLTWLIQPQNWKMMRVSVSYLCSAGRHIAGM